MMWARVVELMLGCWLAASPFVFRHPAGEPALWANDLACGLAVVVLSLLFFWEPARHAHFGTGAVGLWLVAFAFLTSAPPAPPALQNDLLVGLLLLMHAIVPNEASLPPRSWRPYLRDAGDREPDRTAGR
jgi:hypothetical protein